MQRIAELRKPSPQDVVFAKEEPDKFWEEKCTKGF